MKTCKYATCPNPATRKGLCNAHYMKEYRLARKAQQDYLPQFIAALPTLLRQVGISNCSVTYHDGAVTIRKGSLSHTWRP